MSRNPFEETSPPEDYGPEWWAKGGELCTCGHRLDQHSEVADWYGDGSGTRFPCGYSEGGIGWSNRCACVDFVADLDKQ